MGTKGSREKDELLTAIKKDISEDMLPNTERSYQLLDDGTLVVHAYSERVLMPQTYRLNLSVGRELSREEWDANHVS